jgi:crotonobetainyl-CoA:carnitine CoA-transferase CaiB-like acyl-CoA transferase
MAGPLHGLRALDLTIDMAGPLAGMMLADAGAEVIKVEPPGGDPTSHRPGFVAWNRGKARRICDLDRTDDREAFDGLLDGVDIVLVGTAPGAITYQQLEDRGLVRPRGVWMIVSPYLLSGTPWAGGEESAGLVFADMGHAWSQSSYDDVPVDCVYPLIPCLQGIGAAAGAGAAARSHRRDGRARTVAVGAAQAGVMVSPGAYSRAVDAPTVHPPGGPGGSLPNYRCYRCSDGEWLFLGAYTAAFIRRALGVLGLDRLLDDPRMDGDPSHVRRPANFSWIVEEFDRRFATQPRSRWVQLLEAADVPVAPALATADWLQHPQVVALGLREEVSDGAGRHIVMPGPPIRFAATPAVLGVPASGPAPALGTDPWSWSVTPPGQRLAADEVTAGGAPPASFLHDVRVVDLGTIIAGPYAATLLAELGAEVIKVERPPHGDEFRTATGGQGRGGFTSYNRNQLGMAVDLRAAPGRVAFDALLDETDVVVDNFRPGVLERLAMDWKTLAANRPGLVSVSISAFGGAGPLGSRPGFDPVVQALSGIMRTQGGADPADSPAFLTVPINDVLAAALGSFGVCAALLHRDTTGRGQQIDVPLVAASCLLQMEQLIEIDGERTLSGGDRDFCGPTPLNRLYQAVDGWLRLDGHWPSDVTRLQEAGLLSAHSAGRDESLVGAELAETIGRRPAGEIIERANAAGVPAARARTLAEVGLDPRLRGEGVTADGEDDSRLMEPGGWYESPGRPARPAGPAPTYGQHTTRLLRRLDLDDALIADLFRLGAVAGE